MTYILDLIKEYILIAKWQIESKKHPLPPPQWQKGNKGDVLLINGWSESWYFLKIIGDYLNMVGYRIWVPMELGMGKMSIAESVRAVQNLMGKRECVIVAHSKGGIIGLNLINQSSQFKKLIAIATPFGGSIWGSILPDKTLKELRLGRNVEINNIGEKVICIYPKFDNHVIPLKNALLNGAKQIQINIVGHTRILKDKKTLEIIKGEIGG